MRERNKRKAIYVHIDADAFFASVEQVLHRDLRGKAIVVGQNGGIVSALSYPAKNLGVPRVMPITTVRKKFPNVQVVASDFYAYKIFSERMGNIIRNTFPTLVKNSVDEGVAEISNQAKNFDEAFKKVKVLQKELFEKLGCTFSFGIARTPLLAKLASGLNKPHGITLLTPENTEKKIYHLDANELSGVGRKGYEKLKKLGIHTIGDLARASTDFLKSNFSINMLTIQQQILGIDSQTPKQKDSIKSMSRARSFSPVSSYEDLYSQLSTNIEHLCKRLRKEDLYTNRIGVGLRNADLSFTNEFKTLSTYTRNPHVLLSAGEKLLKSLFEKGIKYRQVAVTFANLNNYLQKSLFEDVNKHVVNEIIFEKTDHLEELFGAQCLSLGSSMKANADVIKVRSQRVPGDVYPHPLLPGESVGRRLPYPYLGEVR